MVIIIQKIQIQSLNMRDSLLSYNLTNLLTPFVTEDNILFRFYKISNLFKLL